MLLYKYQLIKETYELATKAQRVRLNWRINN